MTRAQRIVTALADANRATRELGADLNELRLSRGIEPDDDTAREPESDRDPDDDDTDRCDCPCEACGAGDCKNCSMSPCDDPNCDHGDGGPNDDDDEE
jgi:hypothetical protein